MRPPVTRLPGVSAVTDMDDIPITDKECRAMNVGRYMPALVVHVEEIPSLYNLLYLNPTSENRRLRIACKNHIDRQLLEGKFNGHYTASGLVSRG